MFLTDPKPTPLEPPRRASCSPASRKPDRVAGQRFASVPAARRSGVTSGSAKPITRWLVGAEVAGASAFRSRSSRGRSRATAASPSGLGPVHLHGAEAAHRAARRMFVYAPVVEQGTFGGRVGAVVEARGVRGDGSRLEIRPRPQDMHALTQSGSRCARHVDPGSVAVDIAVLPSRRV